MRLLDSKEVLKSERETLKAELDILIETILKPTIESKKKRLKKQYSLCRGFRSTSDSRRNYKRRSNGVIRSF